MPQPTRYVPSYDFSDFQADNPSDPLPGDRVDLELAALRTTTDETLDNLALIQRDDGALANSIVTLDSLSAAARAIFALGGTVRGPWATGTAYAVGDVVSEASKSYLCVVAHTSGTFSADLAASRWVVIGNGGSALDALGALVPAADRLPYFTGADTAALAVLTGFGRSLVGAADAATARVTLGLQDALASLTTAEITQLLKINANVISAAQWGYLAGMTAQPLEPNAAATVTNLTANTVSSTTLTLTGLLSNTALTNGVFDAARFRNTSQGASASTRFSLGNFADPSDFSIILNGTGNNAGPGLRGVTIRANGGAMNLEAAGGLTVPSSVASDSDQNGPVTHLRLRNLNAGASAQTQLAIGNDVSASDFTFTLNSSMAVGGAGPRGALVNVSLGDLLLSGGGTQLRLDASGFIVSTAVYTATVAAAANVTVDSNGLIRRNTSALKYKSEIADYTRGLADLQALRPVTFKSVNQDDDNTYAGFVAEEVHDAGLAEYVVYDPQGAPDALHYPHMIALATAAIKELAEQVSALQDEVASLQTRVTALEAP